jgi:hypothetical protein
MRITAEQFVGLVYTVEAYLRPTWIGPVSDNRKAREVAITLQEFMIHEGIVVGEIFVPFEYTDAFIVYTPRVDSGSVSASGRGYEHEMETGMVDSGFGYQVVRPRQATGPQADYDFLRSSTIGGVAYAISKFGLGRSNEVAMKFARGVDLIFTILTFGLLAARIYNNKRSGSQESRSSGPRRAFEEFTRPTNGTGTQGFEPSGPNVSRQLPGTSAGSGQAGSSFSQRPVPSNPRWQSVSMSTRADMARVHNRPALRNVRQNNPT